MSVRSLVQQAHRRVPFGTWLHSRLYVSAMQMDFNYDLISLAIPLLAIHFGASSIELGLLASLQRSFYIIVCPISGRLSDRWGRKSFAICGALSFALVCLVLSRTTNMSLLFWAVPAIGLTLGCFWPALQGWLSSRGEASVLSHSTSLFNVFWSAGSMAGMVLAGLLMQVSTKFPFYVAAGIAGIIALVLGGAHQGRGSSTRLPSDGSFIVRLESEWDHAQRRSALASLFLCFIVIGSVNTQFPKLATHLGQSPWLIGLTMAFLPFWRTLGFALVGTRKAEADISRYLFAAKLILILSMSILVISTSRFWFIVAFSLLGFVAATTFSLSQYLCLRNSARAGRRIGWHESLMVSGLVIGAMLSGWLAQDFGFQVNFSFGAILSALTLMAQPRLFLGTT